jgi:hypothetical protein
MFTSLASPGAVAPDEEIPRRLRVLVERAMGNVCGRMVGHERAFGGSCQEHRRN